MAHNTSGNNDTYSWPGWHPEPNTRGTWNIYSSCVITISLCVWQAVHLNIPAVGEPAYKQMLRKIKWMVTALLAPELVMLNAFTQYLEAREILKAAEASNLAETKIHWLSRIATQFIEIPDKLRMHLFHKWALDKFNEEQSTMHAQKGMTECSWSMECAFYAASGGIVWPREPADASAPVSYTVIAPGALKWLLRNTPNIVPRIRQEEVIDKGKANTVAKAIVCVQAFWFCAGCVTRLAQHLPISLLELNTFAHCICTFLIYGVWWYKPYDASFPTVFESDDLTGLRNAIRLWKYRAWICQQHEELSTRQRPGERQYAMSCPTCLGKITPTKEAIKSNEYEIYIYVAVDDMTRIYWNLHCHPISHPRLDDGDAWVHSGERIPNTGFIVFHPANTSTLLSQSRLKFWETSWTHLQRVGWNNLIQELFHRYPEDPIVYDFLDVSPRTKNWQIPGDFTPLSLEQGSARKQMVHAILAVFAGAVYGGVHLIAWNADFPTSTEQVLWKISGAYIAGSFFLYFVLARLTCDLSEEAIDIMSDSCDRREWCAFLGCLPTIGLWILSVIAMFLARWYLIVEAFIALPRTADNVYQLPTWSIYLPHIT